MTALVIIPTYLRTPGDLEVTLEALEALRRTEPDVETLIVDDCSPATELVDALATHSVDLRFELHRKSENSGFSKTVNIGLERALAAGQDAVLMNADLEPLTEGWLAKTQAQLDSQGRPASVVGALLLYGNGLIQHAGIYFSMLTRSFDHRFRFAPGALPEAKQPWRCPVTGAFQFIRHECLTSVGLYDESFSMAYEDVDYCLRVFDSGRDCIYQPKIKALHHESLFRGRADQKLTDWQTESWHRLMDKHRATNMAQWIPALV